MFVDTAEWIPDLLELHLEELLALWQLRLAVLESPEWFCGDLAKLDHRIDAHADGLVVAGSAAVGLLEKGLDSADRAEAFAAAWPLLMSESPERAALVLDAAERNADKDLSGLADAFALSPHLPLQDRWQKWLEGDDPNLAGLAALHSAVRQRTAPGRGLLPRLLRDSSPATRIRGWNLAAISGCPELSRETFVSGMEAPETDVRSAAVEAAIWSGQAWLLDHCRASWRTAAPSQWLYCECLARLGSPGDQPEVEAMLAEPGLGPRRPLLAGWFGHPGFLPRLCEFCSSQDAALAAAASTAFQRMTGQPIGSGQSVPLEPDEPVDDFEREFLETVELPDAERARQLLDTRQSEWDQAPRWIAGHPVKPDTAAGLAAMVDLQARWQVARFMAWHRQPVLDLRDLSNLQIITKAR